jgi:hypothetical protein
MKKKRFYILLSILFVLIASLVVIANKTRFFIPTQSGKLTQDDPYDIPKYPNSNDWNHSRLSNGIDTFAFTTTDESETVLAWYDSKFINGIWARRPDLKNTYYYRDTGEYWLGITYNEKHFTITISFHRPLSPF